MFSNNAYAKVWEIKPSTSGKSKIIRISTSRKNDNGEYEQDFSGYVRLVGNANAANIKEGDRVQLLSIGVTTNYVKEKNITYTNYICFDLKVMDNNRPNTTNSYNSGATPAYNQGGSNYSNNNTYGNQTSRDFMNIPDSGNMPFS